MHPLTRPVQVGSPELINTALKLAADALACLDGDPVRAQVYATLSRAYAGLAAVRATARHPAPVGGQAAGRRVWIRIRRRHAPRLAAAPQATR